MLPPDAPFLKAALSRPGVIGVALPSGNGGRFTRLCGFTSDLAGQKLDVCVMPGAHMHSHAGAWERWVRWE